MSTSASAVLLTNGSATSSGVYYPGGLSIFSLVLSGGTVALEQLGPDNATWLAVTAAIATSSRSGNLQLQPGTYRANVSGSTGVYARLDRVPY